MDIVCMIHRFMRVFYEYRQRLWKQSRMEYWFASDTSNETMGKLHKLLREHPLCPCHFGSSLTGLHSSL
jgi:hypothetical protein